MRAVAVQTEKETGWECTREAEPAQFWDGLDSGEGKKGTKCRPLRFLI